MPLTDSIAHIEQAIGRLRDIRLKKRLSLHQNAALVMTPSANPRQHSIIRTALLDDVFIIACIHSIDNSIKLLEEAAELQKRIMREPTASQHARHLQDYAQVMKKDDEPSTMKKEAHDDDEPSLIIEVSDIACDVVTT